MNDSGATRWQQSYPTPDMLVGADDPITPETPNEVTYSTLSNRAAQLLMVREYELNIPLNCSLYNRGVNDVYLLSTSRGRFALRISRVNWRSREAIVEELDALHYLRRNGVDVALPVSRRDGDFITDVTLPEGRRSAVVFHWINGVELKYSDPEHSLHCGRLVARMHAATNYLPPCQTRKRLDLECLLTEPLSTLRPRLEYIPEHIRRLDALVTRIEQRIDTATVANLDWGFCHGDVCANNARIEGNKVVLFDFDICGLGWRALDLACYRLDARRNAMESVAWPSFIKGYLEVRPQMESSLEVIGVFMILRYLWTMALWVTLSSEGVMFALAEDFFEGLVPYCEEIESDTKNG